MKELEKLKYYGDSIVINQSMASFVPVEYNREFYFQDGKFLCKVTQNFGDVKPNRITNPERFADCDKTYKNKTKKDMYSEWRECGVSPSDFI